MKLEYGSTAVRRVVLVGCCLAFQACERETAEQLREAHSQGVQGCDAGDDLGMDAEPEVPLERQDELAPDPTPPPTAGAESSEPEPQQVVMVEEPCGDSCAGASGLEPEVEPEDVEPEVEPGEVEDTEPQPLPVGGGPSGTPSDDQWRSQSLYLLKTTEDDWAEPSGIGSEIGNFVPEFLVYIASDGASSVGVHLGTASDGVQDLCAPTRELTSSPSLYPAFGVGPVDLPLQLNYREAGTGTLKAVVNAVAYGFTLMDIMPEDGDLTNGVLTTTMDLREIYPMFQQLSANPTLQTVLDALASFGVVRSPCPTDGEEYCVALKADYLQAQRLDASVGFFAVTDGAREAEECAPTHVTP